jgi:hypothetical protein
MEKKGSTYEKTRITVPPDFFSDFFCDALHNSYYQR